jgi:hypothetical protein
MDEGRIQRCDGRDWCEKDVVHLLCERARFRRSDHDARDFETCSFAARACTESYLGFQKKGIDIPERQNVKSTVSGCACPRARASKWSETGLLRSWLMFRESEWLGEWDKVAATPTTK